MMHPSKNNQEPSPPYSLKKTQEWFGSIIARPIDLDSKMNPIAPSGTPMEEEAKLYILPSLTLKPHQRMEIYNQQYWWRLLSILHDTFPLVVRLTGYVAFNEKIGIPYLDEFPPHTWTLNPIGYKLPDWILKNYEHDDKMLVQKAAAIDLAYNDGFLEKKLHALNLDRLPEPGNFASLLDKTLTLQPATYLFHFDAPFFPVRDEMIQKEGDYYLENPFPVLNKGDRLFYLLFRNHNQNMAWEEISEGEYLFLQLFQKGCSIESACSLMEKNFPLLMEEISENLSEWMQKWVMRELLVL